nr:TonB-dependent receptor [uncultured Albidiferax sp.]
MAPHRLFPRAPTATAVLLALASATHAQSTADTPATLAAVPVTASADASAEGLSPAYAGGQVARGGRAGILGTKDSMDTPFSITSYTNELIQDRQAKSVGEVLQNDPMVRMARGFGNFQEAYFIRGSILTSDDVAYNGMYSLLPRQYIATELFERVEVLRGASAFLNGANPSGGGIGGAVNLLPKRAPNEPLSRVTAGIGSGGQTTLAADIARRFGPDQATGIRLNAATRGGGSAVDSEKSDLNVLALGLDWRSRDVRLSADIGWQDNRLQRTQPNVTLVGVSAVPSAPSGTVNTAQPWSYSNEKDSFGTVRAEFDINPQLTAWAAAGTRHGDEANSLANLNVTNSATGAGNTSRFDNTSKEDIATLEAGLRGKLRTGDIGHEWVVSAQHFNKKRANSYAWDFFNTQTTNLYAPSYLASQPAFTSGAFTGGTLGSPTVTARTRLSSIAVADTLAFLDDRLLLTLGLRSQTIQSEGFAYGTGVQTDSYSKSHTSPMAAVVYKLDKQVSLYANAIEGLVSNAAPTNGYNRSGAYVTVANGGQQLSPQVSRQKEIGVKVDGGRFGGSLALFTVNKPHYVINSANSYSAEGEDLHRGMELNTQGELTKGLRLLGGLTWLHAKQKSAYLAAADGKRVIGVPKVQATLGTEWDVPGVPGLALDGRVAYTGASFADAVNTLKVPGWTRLDAGVRYLTEVQGKVLTLRLRVDNVANKKYWASSGGYPDNGYLVVGAPRSFNLSASVDF